MACLSSVSVPAWTLLYPAMAAELPSGCKVPWLVANELPCRALHLTVLCFQRLLRLSGLAPEPSSSSQLSAAALASSPPRQPALLAVWSPSAEDAASDGWNTE